MVQWRASRRHRSAISSEATRQILLTTLSRRERSLANLGNSMAVVQEMRFQPFGWQYVTRLAIITATAYLSLRVTFPSLEDFATFVVKAIL